MSSREGLESGTRRPLRRCTTSSAMEAQPAATVQHPDAAQKIGTACTVLPSDHSGVNRALAVCVPE